MKLNLEIHIGVTQCQADGQPQVDSVNLRMFAGELTQKIPKMDIV